MTAQRVFDPHHQRKMPPDAGSQAPRPGVDEENLGSGSRALIEDHHYKTLSDLSIAFAEVFAAGVALPYFLDNFRPVWALFGVVAALGFSIAALYFSRS